MDTSKVNVSEFCAQHGLSRQTFYSIRRRFEEEGEAGLVARSRAPHTVRNRTALATENEIVRLRKELSEEGLDAGAVTIEWHLKRDSAITQVPSVSTIWRILKARGFIVDDPSKAPKHASRSFAAERANQVWQIDGTNHDLADGTTVKIINIIDDGSRVCPSSQVHAGETLEGLWATFLAGSQQWGLPERVLSDNGTALRALTKPLAELGISRGHSRPYHPQTCGKVERFHQTQDKWLLARPTPATTEELQALLDEFRHVYNHERPHRGIGRNIPAEQWAAMPRSGPKDKPLELAGQCIETRKVSPNGTLSFNGVAISVGQAYRNNQATVIATAGHIHVFIDTELARKLTIAPTTRQAPIHPGPGRPRKKQP